MFILMGYYVSQLSLENLRITVGGCSYTHSIGQSNEVSNYGMQRHRQDLYISPSKHQEILQKRGQKKWKSLRMQRCATKKKKLSPGHDMALVFIASVLMDGCTSSWMERRSWDPITPWGTVRVVGGGTTILFMGVVPNKLAWPSK